MATGESDMDGCSYPGTGEDRAVRRIALVLWKGDIGGAEVVSVGLARALRSLGTVATVVFIEGPEPLAGRLRQLDLPYRTVGLGRGRSVLHQPRRYARAVAAAGPDGALLVTCGYMGAALRLGGYRAPIVGVEHGDILYEERPPAVRWANRFSGALADDIEVGVSDFIHDRLVSGPHARDVRRIYNGIEVGEDDGGAVPARADGGPCALAFAGRLIDGKGLDHLLRALVAAGPGRFRLRVAGEGPARAGLEEQARRLGVDGEVEFTGLDHRMRDFWRACDVAVVPSAEFVEACPMTPLEAMAAGRPVVATINGGLPELVRDGVTGALVPPGDPAALAAALERYAADPGLRAAHGEAGRARVEERFSIARCARAYLDLFEALGERRARRPRVG
jgi:glycosyltransferase involved in cell wall biosynthesis